MTAKITGGDYVFENTGKLVEIDGKEEILQRALFRLQANYGQFELDKTLGSELYLLDLKTASTDRIMTHIIEALMPIEQIEVIEVEKAIREADDGVLITVYVTLGGEAAIIEFVG